MISVDPPTTVSRRLVITTTSGRTHLSPWTDWTDEELDVTQKVINKVLGVSGGSQLNTETMLGGWVSVPGRCIESVKIEKELEHV